jgi:nitrogen-specific signal transduction histidine kinase
MITKAFYSQLLENDLNPFLLFNSNGKLKSCNKEAEFLLNFTTVRTLYDLAISNASQSYGFNQKYISLKYNKLSFYAILVGYENDEEIVLRLYKVVSNQINKINQEKLTLVNLYSLIDLSKISSLIDSDLQIQELYDISIPEMKININQFIIILNICFSYFKNEKKISLKVHIKVGEYEILDNKRYKIVALEFSSNSTIKIDKELERKAKKENYNLFICQNKLTLEFPMILDNQ